MTQELSSDRYFPKEIKTYDKKKKKRLWGLVGKSLN